MLSTPPAMAKLPSWQWSRRAACITALMPEAQRRFTVSAGMVCGSPESSSAMRATLRLSSPAWLAQPSMRSVIWVASRLCGAMRACSAAAAKSSGRALHRLPPRLPMAVRVPFMRYAFNFLGNKCVKN